MMEKKMNNLLFTHLKEAVGNGLVRCSAFGQQNQ